MKGIILAAGYGTRFLPVSKSVPKELLPLINKPSISFIIEEFIASGIKDLILITSRRKKAIEDYLDRDFELEINLPEHLSRYLNPPPLNICYVRQKQMLGTGHALLLAKPWIGNEPVVVAYPDDLHVGSIPLAQQLINCYEETGKNVLCTVYDPPSLNRYGVLKLAEDSLHVEAIVEKPAMGQEPSRQASIGRFLYTPDFFHYLEEGWLMHQKMNKNQEYFHIHALNRLMKEKKVVYTPLQGERWDIGESSGYFKALLRYAQTVEELNEILKEEKARF